MHTISIIKTLEDKHHKNKEKMRIVYAACVTGHVVAVKKTKVKWQHHINSINVVQHYWTSRMQPWYGPYSRRDEQVINCAVANELNRPYKVFSIIQDSESQYVKYYVRYLAVLSSYSYLKNSFFFLSFFFFTSSSGCFSPSSMSRFQKCLFYT